MCYRTIKHEGLLQELRDALSVESFQRQEQCTVKETKDNILQIEEIKREQQGCADRAIKHEGLLQELRDALSAENFQHQEQCTVKEMKEKILQIEEIKREQQGCADRAIRHEGRLQELRDALSAESFQRQDQYKMQTKLLFEIINSEALKRKEQFEAHVDFVWCLLSAAIEVPKQVGGQCHTKGAVQGIFEVHRRSCPK